METPPAHPLWGPPPQDPRVSRPVPLVDGDSVLVPGPSPPPLAVVRGGVHSLCTEGRLSLGCLCVSFAGVGLETEA